MDRNEVEQRAKVIVAEHLAVDRERVTNEANLIDDLDADSLDAIELFMVFEDVFNVALPDDDVEDVKTVGDLIDAVVSKLAA